MTNRITDKKTKLIIFDLDGTLADTVGSLTEAVNSSLKKMGHPTRSVNEVRCAIGNGARLLCQRTLPKDAATDENISRMLEIFTEEYRKTYDHVFSPYDGILPALQSFKEKGYKLAVFSNKQHQYVEAIINEIFPACMFDAVEGQKDGRPTKPDPTAALEICRNLGALPSETIMVGDGDTDIKMSHNAGMKAVGVTWGYRSRRQLEEAAEGNEVTFISAPSELTKIIDGLQ